VARPLRLQFAGALYHVTARGNAREAIFRTTADYERFLELLEQVLSRYGWVCHAYCLLGNHYHLIVETPRANLAAGMRHLNGVYAQAFNRAHRRVGHVLQGRYCAVLVEKERHLLALSRYVALNPVRAGLCRAPADWPWSSYRAMCGRNSAPPFLTSGWLLSCFHSNAHRARDRYRRFVESEDDVSPWEELRARLYLGDEDFAAQASTLVDSSSEVPREQREPVRPRLADLLTAGGGEEIALAHKGHGYRLNEIAACLGVHYATVSRRLRAWEDGRPMLQRKT
jgi:REP element-mobilizing transposase RayT